MMTFEKIRDLERAERENKQLQKLPDNLIEELKSYLRKKESLKNSSLEIIELENVKNSIKRFFELREKKIAESALYTVQTGLPVENLAKSEEGTFYIITGELKRLREEFFAELQKMPEQKEEKVSYIVRKTLPKFIGPDMKEYELKENEIIDIAAMPKPLNDLLLKEGVIEETRA